jgi:hypothetical protein
MNIPTIGGARGIFEIFIPGMFLLLNVGAVVYVFPFTDIETKNLITTAASNPAIALVIFVGFGYLIGVLLRLLRTDLPDQWSAAWIRKFHQHARQKNGEFALWVSDDFPYIAWIGEMCKLCLPPDAQIFYDKVWATRKRTGQNKQFFNYCKVLINSKDEKAANEIYIAESLTRYISDMFYALLFAFVLIFVTVIVQYSIVHQVTLGLVIILIAYLVALAVIVDHFRFIRIKEVETVFVASFHNRELFQQTWQYSLSDGDETAPR